MVKTVRFLTERGIPVCGHLGLTPQSVHQLGGYRVQGKEHSAADRLLEEAQLLEDAGAGMIVLEAIPAALAKRVTESVRGPTIGIGAGVDCHGQVLVLHDMLGIRSSDGPQPRFVKHYAEVGDVMRDAVERYAGEVRGGEYPAPEHTYSMPPEEVEAFQRAIGGGSIEENALADW